VNTCTCFIQGNSVTLAPLYVYTLSGHSCSLNFHTVILIHIHRGLETRFHGNVLAQDAARMLKVALLMSCSPRPASFPELPAFVMELLVLEAQSLFFPTADSAMALFCDTLQLVVDSPDGSVLNEVRQTIPSYSDTQTHTHTHAHAHTRTRSRTYTLAYIYTVTHTHTHTHTH
jgi:hypothetical protein